MVGSESLFVTPRQDKTVSKYRLHVVTNRDRNHLFDVKGVPTTMKSLLAKLAG